jgi:AcrR family transcriptional regulator
MARKRTARPRPVAGKPGRSGIQLGEASARAMILQGAARTFAERGVRAASVDDILKASRVSRRTFYRLYQSKEDVVQALYRIGTESLLAGCRAAVEREADPLRQVQGCIDAHLRNAREHGRLVFLLGGEAQRAESSVHARRMEVHDAIVELLQKGWKRGKRPEPLVARALVMALEGVTRIVLAEGDEGRKLTELSIERARRVMARLATATLAGEGPGVTPLPELQ